MKSVVYILGNPFIPEDSAAITLLPRLRRQLPHITFIHLDPTEGIPSDTPHPTFIDTVQGISEVTVFDSLHHFSPPPRVTAHDYDLYQELVLLKKIESIQSFRIVAVPPILQKKLIHDIISFLSTLR